MHSYMTHREFLRHLLAAEDLTPREVELIERLDSAIDEIDDLKQELREHEDGQNT